MSFVYFMFSSIYDQVALAITAILLLVNAILDVIRSRAGVGRHPRETDVV
jgi:hypothetical protein